MSGGATAAQVESPVLELDGVGKRFGDHTVLDDVSLTVQRGEFVALLGPSGAGKTTLIRCMTGMLKPDAGHIRVCGVDMANLHGRERRRVAVVFQQFNLVRRLSALDNVLAGRLGYVAPWRGWVRQFDRADRLLALECLDRVGLLRHAAQRADTLSGGQQQRVALARALAQRAEVIVADEPVASLDPAISAGILDLLRGICEEDGVTVVCSLHQLHLAQSYARRLIGLADGRVQFDCRAEDVNESATRTLYQRNPQAA